MSVADLKTRVPRFTVPTIAGLLLITLLYSVFVSATLLLWFALWGGLLGIGVGLYVVYLLYRLVLAVERIADDR